MLFKNFPLRLIQNKNLTVVFASSSDPPHSTEEPRHEQTPGLLSTTASTLCCRCGCCHASSALLPPPGRFKLKPCPVSESAAHTGAAACGTQTHHLLDTHACPVFTLLTWLKYQSGLNHALKAHSLLSTKQQLLWMSWTSKENDLLMP